MAPSVCILTTVHSPSDTRIFHKQAKTLARAGYDVTLIARHGRDETIDGIKILSLPEPQNRLTRMIGLTWRAFCLALRQRADLYHFHDPELLPVGFLLKLLSGAKVIYDVHEDVPRQIIGKHWIPGFLRRPVAGVFSVIEKVCAQRLHAIIPATEAIARHFKAHRNLVVIHNYPDLRMLPEVTQCTGRRGGSLLYIGGISLARGGIEMVSALANVPESMGVRLTLIGRFVPAELESQVRGLSAFRCVDYLGTLPWETAWGSASGAAAGLVLFHPGPNHTEALPNKLFEYMAAGIPVIASHFPLWREIVEGNECGLTVDPLDPQAIADAICYLIEHPDEAREMGRRGREAVERMYNWETEAKKLLAVYERILS